MGGGLAAHHFKESGVGKLMRREDGSIDIDTIYSEKEARKAVRVQIVDKGAVTGESRPFGHREGDNSLRDKILTARDFIYEDELFFEIVREARRYANLGIRTSEDQVTIEIQGGRAVQIDMVPFSCPSQ